MPGNQTVGPLKVTGSFEQCIIDDGEQMHDGMSTRDLLTMAVHCSYQASESKLINSLVGEENMAAACSFQAHMLTWLQTNPYAVPVPNLR